MRDRARALAGPFRGTAATERQADRVMLAMGEIQARLAAMQPPGSLRDAEYKVFSQWGEDGIIQYLIDHVEIPNRQFVEIGVESYAECNTRFLAIHSNWAGLVVDGGTAHIDRIKAESLDWRYGVTPVSAFVTRENINALISDSGLVGDIGLLSLDIDGVDYWVLEAMEVVAPRILILEYNSAFGPDAAVTVPYKPDFNALAEHYSFLYWGASLHALADLAATKGYTLVGCESHGANAFFVRTDVLGDLTAVTVEDGYVEARFRMSRGADGELNYVAGRAKQLAQFAHLPLVEVPSGNPTTAAAVASGTAS
jgi:hypothetical protein